MKPPNGNRPGGSGRPPSDRGPFRGGGGGQQGQHRDGTRQGQQGQRHDGPRGQGHGQGHGQGQAGHRQGGHGQAGQGQGGGGFHNRDRQRPDREQQHRHGGGHGPRPNDGPRRPPESPRGTIWLYGHHAVLAALANPARRLRRLVITEEAEAELAKSLPQPWALAPEREDRGRLDHLLGRDIVHQGVALLADPLPQPTLQSVLDRPGPIIVLDQVTDPRNVGAILRSAAAFGAAGVIMQERNGPDESGALAKAASGALETMPLIRAVNIARTLIALKAVNVWCVGLDASGTTLAGASFAGRRVALVLGAEGEGLRRLTKETCDEVAGLRIKGGVDSLNVSAAAAVALYEITRPA